MKPRIYWSRAHRCYRCVLDRRFPGLGTTPRSAYHSFMVANGLVQYKIGALEERR